MTFAREECEAEMGGFLNQEPCALSDSQEPVTGTKISIFPCASLTRASRERAAESWVVVIDSPLFANESLTVFLCVWAAPEVVFAKFLCVGVMPETVYCKRRRASCGILFYSLVFSFPTSYSGIRKNVVTL